MSTRGETEPLLTRWGRELDPERPLPEHPRPQLVRQAWANLNGPWECAFTHTSARPTDWPLRITVPFSPETILSGVGRQLQPDEWLWYRRTCTPFPGTGRVLLHFGAVDQSCTVWVNGREVGDHTGGYLPFSLDVTDAVTDAGTGTREVDGATSGGPALVEVRVRDLSETGVHARGKQRLDRGEIWYTAQSGIWQTVWLEQVPVAHVTGLDFVPHLATGSVTVTVRVNDSTRSAARVTLLAEGRVVGTAEMTPGVPTPIQLDECIEWSPERPFLYDVQVVYAEDHVASYTALREVGIEDIPDRPRLTLNGKPLLHLGVLDQGYWPEGLLTPPSDAAIVQDLETVRALGYNAIRKHVKIEPLRWYYHCDRLGILVWQDMVNGGGRYRHLVTTLPATRPVRIDDRRHRVFHRDDVRGREEFREEVRRTVALLGSSPCITVWVPFNEGWGQFDSSATAAEINELDPTRPVCAVSGWIDQGGGQIRSFHRYRRRFRMPRRLPGRRSDARVIALDEYGGRSLVVSGHIWDTTAFGHGNLADAEELAEWFSTGHAELERQVRRGLAALFYTQLTDVEDELNGLLTWDREVLKLDPAMVRRTLSRLRAAGPA